MANIESGLRTQATPPNHPLSAPTIWSLISRACRRFAQRHAQARRNRRDLEALYELGEHELKDIGLTRGQIASIVANRSGRCAGRDATP